jgi:hypothetical protein
VLPISVEVTGKIQLEPGQGFSSVLTLLFAKKSLAETDWCAVAFS